MILILGILLPLIAVFRFAAVGFAAAEPKRESILYQPSGHTEATTEAPYVSPSGIPSDPDRVEDIVDKATGLAGTLITGINSMWSVVGQTIQNFAADDTMLIGFTTSEMETFAEGLSFIFKTLGYCIVALVFALSILDYSMKFEFYEKKQYLKVFVQLLIGKLWVDWSIKIVLVIFKILNSVAYVISDPSTMELLPQYTPERAWYSYIPVIGAIIDFFVAILEVFPLILTLLTIAIVIICIFVKLTIRCFEMTCLVTVAPAFMACFAGDITKKYGQRYIETVISIGLDLVFIAVVYTLGLQWLNKLAAENPGGIMEFGEYVSRMILIVAMGVVICKPPKVLTGLVGW